MTESTEEGTGTVMTATDVRLEEIERKLASLESENSELRKANAELYAYAKQKEGPSLESVTAQKEPTFTTVGTDTQPTMDYDQMEKDVLRIWHLT